MRVFQNSGLYRAYMPRLGRLTAGCTTFAASRDAFLADRYGAIHLLKPVVDGDPSAFFTNGDDPELQGAWAREKGMKEGTSLEEILLAQIEDHRAEVFYNTDPMRYGDAFLEKLPGSVKRTIAWRAAPSRGGAFLKHDLVVNNFPGLLAEYERQGARTAFFSPSHDPAMDPYAANQDRPIDVLFVGSYSQHHQKRARMLEALAAQRSRYNIVMHFAVSRLVKLAETPAGWVGPLRKHRRPKDIRAVARGPIFGRELLDALGQAKIVVNGEIDMMAGDRGNMRIWEALGCGAALVSDDGRYQSGMEPGRHFLTYSGVEDMLSKVERLLRNADERREIASQGHGMISTVFSKAEQWKAFEALAG